MPALVATPWGRLFQWANSQRGIVYGHVDPRRHVGAPRDGFSGCLAPVYGWFTEGFDTLDLKEAKTLLNELS
jgi:hypothetical protein